MRGEKEKKTISVDYQLTCVGENLHAILFPCVTQSETPDRPRRRMFHGHFYFRRTAGGLSAPIVCVCVFSFPFLLLTSGPICISATYKRNLSVKQIHFLFFLNYFLLAVTPPRPTCEFEFCRTEETFVPAMRVKRSGAC